MTIATAEVETQEQEGMLITLDKFDLVALFGAGGSDFAIAHIKKQVEGFVPDLTTAKGRKEIAGMAYKVARSKTLLDDAGKKLVADIKKQSAIIDQERKKIRDDLDFLRDEIRRPLTEWEEEQERIKAAEELAKKIESDHAEAIIFNEQRDREIELKRREDELNRIEQERQAKADQDRMMREIAERAREEERAKAEKLILEERLAKERAEKEKREAEARLEREKQEAVEAEKKRQADELKRAEEETRKRQQDIEHRRAVNAQALSSLVAAGVPDEFARVAITAIARGDIPNVRIEY